MTMRSRDAKKRKTKSADPGETKLDPIELEVLQSIADEGEDGFLIPVGSDEEVQEFLDCTWRRITCGKMTCPMCSRIQRSSDRARKEGKDPDSAQVAFESMAADLAESLMLLKKEAEARGIDIENLEDALGAPDPEFFPLAATAIHWYKNVVQYYQKEDKRGAIWLMTEAGSDLIWYAGLFSAKVYRQLCNQWHLKRGDTYGSFDHSYTERVLGEVREILAKSFARLHDLAPDIHKIEERFFKLDARVRNGKLYKKELG